MRENTHLSQKTDSYETLASLGTHDKPEGVRQIRITVLNESVVTVETFGRSHDAFQSLKDDVETELRQQGYEVKHLNFGDL